MSQKTAIGWTDATWNPVTGCSHVSDGCRNCYAEALELRFGRSTKPWTAQNAAENVKMHPDRLKQPLSWREPRRVFVNSMSDMFHELVPFEFLDQCFAVMALASRHTFQILTKRTDRMLAYTERTRRSIGYLERPANAMGWALTFEGKGLVQWPLPNVWLGTSIENQRFVHRARILATIAAARRFLSLEPLLGPVEATLNGIDWVIVGGESGPDHRPMELDWARTLRDACQRQGIAFFLKQLGGWPDARAHGKAVLDGRLWTERPAVGVV